MRKFVMIALVALATANVAAYAADANTCAAQATSKKLSGAAKNSFMQKCEKDSKAASPQAMCEGKAADKKLAGAAKNSFVKKCVKDAAAG
jgi:hypothetical protein